MNPINNQNSNKPTTFPRMQNNEGASNPTVSQLNNPANKPEGLEQASQLPQDVQEDLIYTKEYTSKNIWEAYTDAQKIRNAEKQADFLKRVLQSHIDMGDFYIPQLEKLQDLIKGFAQPIQKDLYCLIVNTDKYPFQLRILALRQIELSLEEKEAYLSSIREQLLKPEVLKFINYLNDVSLYLQDFPKTIKNEVFKHIAHNAYFTKVRLDALKLLDIPSAELKTICLNFWSNNWWARKSIQDFPESIQQDLCRSILDSTLPLEERISALNESDLTSDEKETYLSDVLRKPLEKDQLKFLLRNLKFFPKPIQDKCYMQIAESDYSHKVRLKALQLLDMSSAEQKAFFCRIFSEKFCQEISDYSVFKYIISFPKSCPNDLKADLCAQIAKYESLFSPVRMKIVKLMEAGPVKDEALSVMVGSDFFKLKDKIKLAKLINDSSLKLTLLEDLLVNAPYTHFEYMDKYGEKGKTLKKAFNCEASLALRLETCFEASETSPVGDLKHRILEQFFKSCPVDRVRLIELVSDLFIELNQDEKDLIISHFPENERSDILKCFFENCYTTIDHFCGILDVFFEEGSQEERQLIMVNFPKCIMFDKNQSFFDRLLPILFDRFERFYQACDFDQETKKTVVMNLLLNSQYLLMLSDYRHGKGNVPIDLEAHSHFCEHVWNLYVGEFPEECKAPAGGILEAIALNATIPVNSRQDILCSCVTDERVRDDLLLLTEEDHVMETRFKKMKLPSPNANDE